MHTYKIRKYIAFALLGYLAIMMATVLIGSMADDGILLDAWYAMLEYIPFGGNLGKLCIQLFGDAFGLGKGMSEYVIGIKAITALEYFEDALTLMLTALFFEAVNTFLQFLMGVEKREDLAGVLMRMVCSMVSALICTLIAATLLHYIFSQLSLLPGTAQGLITALISLLTVGGLIGVMYFILQTGILAAFGYALIKVVLVNALKVAATYVGMLLVLLFLSEEAYLKVFSVIAGWGVVIILLFGVDLMLSSVFRH